MKLVRVVFVCLFAACDVVPLEVVAVPDGGETMGQPGPPCASTDECMAGQFCEKPSCGAALGNCIARPFGCDNEVRPQCGCDGVTYLNSCLRRSAGVESSADEPGPCRQPPPCDTTRPCADGAFCARIVFPNECGRVGPGQCWVVPETCGPSPRVEHHYACGQAQTQCLDLCAAVRREEPTARYPGPCP